VCVVCIRVRVCVCVCVCVFVCVLWMTKFVHHCLAGYVFERECVCLYEGGGVCACMHCSMCVSVCV